jgi:predicted ATPase
VPEEVIGPGRLYLQVAAERGSYAPLSRGLRGMRLYDLACDALREAGPYARGAVLGARGQHLASVLGDLGRLAPGDKERLDAYLGAVVPGVISVDERAAGPHASLRLQMSGGAGGVPAEFGPEGMSDGTIRTVGVLAALFQKPALDGDVALVGVEEPMVAVHPSAAGVLFDALTEASDWVQVLVTTP